MKRLSMGGVLLEGGVLHAISLPCLLEEGPSNGGHCSLVGVLGSTLHSDGGCHRSPGGVPGGA